MTATQWLLFIAAIQVIHFLGTWKLYVRAGRKAWEAAVPVYNAVVLMKIINRPWWWTILLFIPIVNLMMFPIVWVETARSFGFNTYKDTFLTVITCGLYLFYINYATDAPYIENRELMPKSANGEWTSSILFAIIAATVVHTYFMQPFTIPTSSLEKTLLVGDYLFVSKFHYGARTPITTVATPMLHDTIPFTKQKSYLSWPQLPYFRLPGFQSIKRNDIVVFSWPIDTMEVITPGFERGNVRKPIDKKSNYVKRCVGLPGDSLEVRDGYVYINGERNELPDRARLQFSYIVTSSKPMVLNVQSAYGAFTTVDPFYNEQYDITDIQYDPRISSQGNYVNYVQLTDENKEKLNNNPSTINIEKNKRNSNRGSSRLFPWGGDHQWSIDEYGPIYIPKKGETTVINQETIPYYKRLIEVYEGSELGIDNKITQNNGQILLNGNPLTEYTFKLDHYWMMGDNRHNSQDARSWGYVPYTHVMGKPVMVWLSLDQNKSFPNNIRWDRMFTTVGGNGPLVSYLWVVGLLIFAYIAWSFFKSRRNKKA
ncbi:signal peptidase I [Dokdonia sinensis]|uniref:Signal peptidase I n=1 Tax=Dokdonia sinensis TaxID=2479847 RepID=A0A3M0GQK1_9FLAO|nr:signal peptidase I [Dokdonia sinensis]RMB63983.1 signal peptidase I [Dokdonia sinensis]